MHFVLRIKGAWVYVDEGKVHLIDKATRVFDKAAIYDPAYETGSWDGYFRLYDYANRRAPAGLLNRIVKFLENRDHTVTVHGRHKPRIVKVPRNMFHGIELHAWQVKAVKGFFRVGRGMLDAATGAGKTEIQAVITRIFIEQFLQEGKHILVVCPANLVPQTVDRFKQRIGDVCEVGRYDGKHKTAGDVIIASPNTVIRAVRDYDRYDESRRWVLANAQMLIIDEYHHGGSDTWYDVAMDCPASWRLGCTGTVKTGSEKKDFRLKAITGPVYYSIKSRDLIEKGALARPLIHMVNDPAIFGEYFFVSKATFRTSEFGKNSPGKFLYKVYDPGICRNKTYNRAVAKLASTLFNAGYATLVLGVNRKHLARIANEVSKLGTPVIVALGPGGKLRTRPNVRVIWEEGKRKRALDACQRKRAVLIGSNIFKEGVDAPNVQAVVLAGGQKAATGSIQRIGRGLRRKTGHNEVLVFDFTHTNNNYLEDHAKKRRLLYEGERWDIRTFNNFGRLLRDIRTTIKGRPATVRAFQKKRRIA